MARDLPTRPDDPTPDPTPEPGGSLAPTGPGPLVLLGVLGLFAGWSVRGASLRFRETEAVPAVSWLAAGTTWFIAALVAGTAYLTWRTVHRDRRRIDTDQAVSRLVLGRTIARLGALVLGGFLGAAISNLGVAGDNAQHALLRALVAAAGAAAALVAGLLLERACRVPTADR